jgi:hypothetical protein
LALPTALKLGVDAETPAADGAMVMISASAAAIPAVAVTTDDRHNRCPRLMNASFI